MPYGKKISAGVSIRALAIRPTDGDRNTLVENRRLGESVVMKYMLLIYMDEQTLDDAYREQCYGESAQLARDLNASGHYLAANPLHPTSMATSVEVRDGKRLVTDGPFAETREQLGGYFLIDAKDLDEAIGIAARIPGARRGTVEIRPVMEIAGLPTG